ncbi:MAG: hypothetical protein ACTJFR_07740 [Canibacter sp.]
MNDPNSELSWDVQRTTAPERPELVSTVPDEELIARPSRIWVAFVFVILAVLAFAAVTALAALRIEDLRESLVGALPDDLLDDYPEDDTNRAAYVLLGSVGGFGALLTLIHLLSTLSLTFGRSGAARVMLVTTVVIFIPVSVLSTIVREDTTMALLVSAIAGVCLVTAVILVCTPRVTRWLRQSAGERSTPLTSLIQPNE